MWIRNTCAFLAVLSFLAMVTAILNEDYTIAVTCLTALVLCVIMTATAHIEEL